MINNVETSCTYVKYRSLQMLILGTTVFSILGVWQVSGYASNLRHDSDLQQENAKATLRSGTLDA